MKKIILLFFVSLFYFQSHAQLSGQNLFDDSYMHEIQIYFEEDDFWEILTDNYFDGAYTGDIEYLMTTQIIIDGNVIDTVGIRQKGFSSHFASNEFKKALKIDFNEFVSGQEYDGLRKVNLGNGVGDPSFQRDMLCYDMMRTAGVPAPRTAHTRLYINDQYWGVYVLIEQVDKSFLQDNYLDDDGNLFKNIGWSALEYLGTNVNNYKENFELKTNETEDNWEDFIELCDVINNTPSLAFEEEIQKVLNVDQYLRVLAIDILTNNWDSYIDHGRNWYLYHEPVSGLFQWIPWDYNLAIGGTFETSGSPIVLDTICPLVPDFTYSYDGDTLWLTDASTDATTWEWTFGDGAMSTDTNPTHIYAGADIYNVCLTISNTFDDSLCTKTKCVNIDLTYDVSDCATIQNGSCPYPVDDPVMQQVMMIDDFCCEVDWDGICQDLYDDIYNGGGPGTGGGPSGISFPLILDNPERVLIDKLMDVTDFRQLYLTHVCEIMENNFTTDRLYPLIDEAADIVRDDIYSDPFYLFTTNYFEWDVGYGGQANGAFIPQIKVFIDERIPQIWEDMDDANFTCNDWTTSLGWMDIVVNEFVASNDSTSGIMDAEGEFEDWIELYNNTDTAVDLFGYYLSDDTDNPKKWAFPAGTVIGPNDYLIVWADQNLSEEGVHAYFKLEKDGEQIILSHQDGTVLDSLTYAEQSTNVPSARVPNGTGDFINQTPTFNATNDITISVFAPELIPFRVYPNPANTTVRIVLDENNTQFTTVTVRNALGQTVAYTQFGTRQLLDINMEDLVNGVYIIEVDDGINRSSKKLVIQH